MICRTAADLRASSMSLLAISVAYPWPLEPWVRKVGDLDRPFVGRRGLERARANHLARALIHDEVSAPSQLVHAHPSRTTAALRELHAKLRGAAHYGGTHVHPTSDRSSRDHVVIVTEGPVGVRIIHLGGQPPPDALRTVEGYSTGQWEGDTLVVQTTHLRGEDPARYALPRPLLLSRHSRITERFIRVSATELFDQFTIDDGELYTQPWVGEFSFRWHDGPIYEYECHEANYSLPNTLRGGQAAAARGAEPKSKQD